jgi:hypothetical protein
LGGLVHTALWSFPVCGGRITRVYAPTECLSVGCWQAEKGSVYCDHQLQSHGVGHAQVLFQLIWGNPIYLSISRWVLGFLCVLRVRAQTTRCVRVRVSPNTPTKIAGVRVRVSPNTSYSRSRSLSLPRWMLGFMCVFACTSADHTVRQGQGFSQHSYENCRVHHA